MPRTLQILATGPNLHVTKCRIQSLRPDIWLAMIPGEKSEDVLFHVQSDDAILALVFLVPRMGKGGEDKLPAGSLCVFPAGTSKLPELSGRGLILCMAVSRLMTILGPDIDTLPEGVRLLLKKKDLGEERVEVPLAPEQVLAGNALFHCPYEGAVRNIFFKSKVMELLALFFGQVARQEKNGGVLPLPVSEQEIVAKARDFLLQHMEAPPGIRQIARHVGVNDTKLKRLFKEAYGLSLYACLRVERLALAREMLLTKGFTVSEAATSVGYSNVGHFINVFTRHYGVRPGELRPRGRQFYSA